MIVTSLSLLSTKVILSPLSFIPLPSNESAATCSPFLLVSVAPLFSLVVALPPHPTNKTIVIVIAITSDITLNFFIIYSSILFIFLIYLNHTIFVELYMNNHLLHHDKY